MLAEIVTWEGKAYLTFFFAVELFPKTLLTEKIL